jgi:hypothetical protein
VNASIDYPASTFAWRTHLRKLSGISESEISTSVRTDDFSLIITTGFHLSRLWALA